MIVSTSLVKVGHRQATHKKKGAPQGAPFFAMHFSKLCPALSSPHTSFGLADLSVELNRGAMSIKVSWPVSAPGACVLWVREVMR